MFLHRGFFAQALADNPTNPLKSAHSQSFLTAYKCACEILDCTRDHYARQQRLVPRVWRIWSNAFSAAVRDITWIAITVRFDFEIYFQVIIGTVAIRTLNVGIEPPPLNKLDHACELFQSAAESSSRASRALVSILALRVPKRITDIAICGSRYFWGCVTRRYSHVSPAMKMPNPIIRLSSLMMSLKFLEDEQDWSCQSVHSTGSLLLAHLQAFVFHQYPIYFILRPVR
jgi:hypothetical protein